MRTVPALAGARRRWLRTVPAFVCALAAAPALALGEESLTHLDDLRATLAQVRRAGTPLLLFFSTPGCPYCAEVRQAYLRPRVAMGAGSGAIVRELDVTSARRFVDRDGRAITEAEFAIRLNVRMTPVVLLVDDRLRPLAEPLVGIGAAGFYESYLQGAIDTARKRLGSGG